MTDSERRAPDAVRGNPRALAGTQPRFWRESPARSPHTEGEGWFAVRVRCLVYDVRRGPSRERSSHERQGVIPSADSCDPLAECLAGARLCRFPRADRAFTPRETRGPERQRPPIEPRRPLPCTKAPASAMDGCVSFARRRKR